MTRGLNATHRHGTSGILDKEKPREEEGTRLPADTPATSESQQRSKRLSADLIRGASPQITHPGISKYPSQTFGSREPASNSNQPFSVLNGIRSKASCTTPLHPASLRVTSLGAFDAQANVVVSSTANASPPYGHTANLISSSVGRVNLKKPRPTIPHSVNVSETSLYLSFTNAHLYN